MPEQGSASVWQPFVKAAACGRRQAVLQEGEMLIDISICKGVILISCVPAEPGRRTDRNGENLGQTGRKTPETC